MSCEYVWEPVDARTIAIDSGYAFDFASPTCGVAGADVDPLCDGKVTTMVTCGLAVDGRFRATAPDEPSDPDDGKGAFADWPEQPTKSTAENVATAATQKVRRRMRRGHHLVKAWNGAAFSNALSAGFFERAW